MTSASAAPSGPGDASTPTELALRIEERRWPDEAAEIQRLAQRRVPRLLLVDETAPPPVATECEEDWIRLPASDDDIAARRESLAVRVARHASPPRMDGHHRLHFAGRWLHIESDIDRRLVKAMLEDFRSVCSTAELIRLGWDGQPATANALRVHIARLNQRLVPLGLRIASLRRAGYALVESHGMKPA